LAAISTVWGSLGAVNVKVTWPVSPAPTFAPRTGEGESHIPGLERKLYIGPPNELQSSLRKKAVTLNSSPVLTVVGPSSHMVAL
jgi:hypothetical protein